MKTLLASLATILAITGGAIAAGSHAGGHGHDEMMAIGKPGDADKVDRAVKVTMIETEDGEMLFEPASLDIREGETIRFSFENKGELEHEFVMDEHHGIMEHKELMAKFPEMEHDDPNAIRLAPGETGEIVWTFANAGDFGFACLIPGHYESGMKGEISVSK